MRDQAFETRLKRLGGRRFAKRYKFPITSKADPLLVEARAVEMLGLDEERRLRGLRNVGDARFLQFIVEFKRGAVT